MMQIDLKFDVSSVQKYELLINDYKVNHQDGFATISCVAPPRMNWIDFVGDVTVNYLELDGIDLLDFPHHGFTSAGSRGNQDSQSVRYYFKTPIWHWFCTRRSHETSYIRALSQNHQGFVPL